MSAKEEEDRSIIINRKWEEVWELVSNPEWFAQIFEGVSIVPTRRDTPGQVDIRQQVAGRWITSIVAVENLNAEQKEVSYRIGSSLIRIGLEPEDAKTKLRVKLWFDPAPSERVLRAYSTSLLHRLKQAAEV